MLDKFWYTTKMWAVIEKETNTVLACIVGIPYEEAAEKSQGNELVEMTLENTPAYLMGKYINGKFYQPEEKQ